MRSRFGKPWQKFQEASILAATCRLFAVAVFVLSALSSRADAATIQVQALDGQPAIRWPAFKLEGRAFQADAVRLPRDGTWHVGVDLGRGEPLALPRAGHRGWLPLAQVKVSDGRVTEVKALEARLPASRIARTSALVKNGGTLRVLVLGSSLLHDARPGMWPAMVLSPASGSPYRLRQARLQVRHAAIQGASNLLQLAQVAPLAELSPDGAIVPSSAQASMLGDVDLVIVGTLANGRADWENATVRVFEQLRRAGVDVVVVTDNASIPTAQVPAPDVIFERGPRLMALADRFGFEVADTAAYVAAAHAAFPDAIYRDHIHMTEARDLSARSPGPSGHEAWARSIFSVLSHSGAVASAPAAGAFGAERAKSAPEAEAGGFLLLPASALARASLKGGDLASHPWPRADVASPQRAAAGKSKVLRLSDGGRFTLRGACMSALHLVWYGEAGSAAAAMEVVHRDGTSRRTNLPGARPFPNLWMQALTMPMPAGQAADELEIRVHGTLALDSLLVERAARCR